VWNGIPQLRRAGIESDDLLSANDVALMVHGCAFARDDEHIFDGKILIAP
jgi:hypothetical protein